MSFFCYIISTCLSLSKNSSRSFSATVFSTSYSSKIKDKIKLSATDGVIEVKNISSSKIDTVYVYYKQKVFNDNLPGSITYRVKLEDIKSGQSKATIANHFSTDDCEIIMVDTI